MSTDYKTIARNGLWDGNIVFGQLLALCPLLAVTGTATNGLGMGLAVGRDSWQWAVADQQQPAGLVLLKQGGQRALRAGR